MFHTAGREHHFLLITEHLFRSNCFNDVLSDTTQFRAYLHSFYRLVPLLIDQMTTENIN